MHTISIGAELKKEAYKKGSLHYNTKIIITDSNTQLLDRGLLLPETEELMLRYAFSMCRDCT